MWSKTMSIRFKASVTVMVVLVLIAGCGKANPTTTPVPLTSTPVPPTMTPVTSTVAATPLPPSSGDGAGGIAFVRSLEGSWGIYVMAVPNGTDADGSDERRLIFDSQALAYPEWSPDGERIAFHKHHSDAVWSINVMDADGGNEQRLTFTETKDAAPVWSPDGSQMVFSRGSDIWVMNADGSDQRLLMTDPAYACCADWSPDGGRIAFESERDGNAEIYVMDVGGASPDARNARRLTDDDAQDWWPAWSPDSTQIAFMSDRDGDWEIYAMDADGRNLRQLTDNEADDREPAWSPDGTQIAFHSNRDTGAPFDSEIYIMNSDGTGQRRITQKAGMEWGIDWRPVTSAAASVQPTVSDTWTRPADGMATPTPTTLTTDRKVQGWAILAQKDDYSDVDMTDLAVDYIGITQMRQVLESSGWKPEHIREQREFDRDTLQEGLDWLAENADQDDVVFLYVAAHGMYLRNVLAWDEFFADEWEQIPSHRRLLVIDSCQAANYTGAISGDPVPYLSIAAVARDEYGWSGLEEEDLPIIGGVFTHYFADAFGDPDADADGNGLVSVQEAARLAEEQQRAYMHDVVFAVPEFLESYHDIGSFPDQDPSFPHVVVDDTVGAPLYLALDIYASDEVVSPLDGGGGVVAPSPTLEPTATRVPPTATPVPLPALQTISTENAGQLIELGRLELPEMEDVHETCGVAFDPTGEKLAACCKSANVAVWDVQTGQRIYTLEAPTGICAHVAFSPDGQTLAAGGHRNVIPLWDTSTGALVREIKRATANVSELAFSPIVTGSHAGPRLAVASFMGSALVWDLETDTRLAQFPLHYSRVNSLNFSPDGKMVVSGGGDNLARVWDASSGEHIIALEGASFYVEDVEFNPEGTQVVGACDDHSIRVWDVGSGDLLHTLWHYGPVNGVTYSPDGKLLASASNDQTIGVWDASSGESLIKLPGHSNLAIATAFGPDGTLIASVSWDGTVRLWGVPAPTAASLPTLGDTWARSTDGMTMVYVPGGTFQMGSTNAQIKGAMSLCDQYPDEYGKCKAVNFETESPQHAVTLDGFWIDRTEVSNAQYALCVADGACPESRLASDPTYNGDDYPVAGVPWQDAMDYCAWAGGRLPTEAQWEYAARGTASYVYPWGNEFDCQGGNFWDEGTGCDDGHPKPAPVGSFPAGISWCGALDMAGNAWEWVADVHSPYPVEAQENPTGPATGSERILRGGSWGYLPAFVRTAYRYPVPPTADYLAVGFRCAIPAGE
jgi:Tol biopolymer transport system component/formylglycine-generating enzyme required for sulfatase activity